MPGYKVNIIDLGLRLQDALDRELGVEEFTRFKGLPSGLTLNAREQEYFVGKVQYSDTGKKSWVCKRVELNAFTAPSLVEYVEQGLRAHGVRGKVVPPADLMPGLALEIYHSEMHVAVDRVLESLLRLDDLRGSLAEQFRRHVPLQQGRRWALQALKEDNSLSWREGVRRHIRSLIEKREPALVEAVLALLLPIVNNKEEG